MSRLLDRWRLKRHARKVGRDPEVQQWADDMRALVADARRRYGESLTSIEYALHHGNITPGQALTMIEALEHSRIAGLVERADQYEIRRVTRTAS